MMATVTMGYPVEVLAVLLADDGLQRLPGLVHAYDVEHRHLLADVRFAGQAQQTRNERVVIKSGI